MRSETFRFWLRCNDNPRHVRRCFRKSQWGWFRLGRTRRESSYGVVELPFLCLTGTANYFDLKHFASWLLHSKNAERFVIDRRVFFDFTVFEKRVPDAIAIRNLWKEHPCLMRRRVELNPFCSSHPNFRVRDSSQYETVSLNEPAPNILKRLCHKWNRKTLYVQLEWGVLTDGEAKHE